MTEESREYISQDVQIDAVAVRERAQYDYALFIALLMDDLLTLPIPDFHLEIFARMVSLDVFQSVYAVPRGFAKTTIVKLAVVHILTFSDIRNIFYFSHTLELAIPSVNDIVKFLRSDNYRKVFGEVQFLVEQEGKGSFKFIMPNGKLCHLKARGANQQVRGTNVDNVRIELAICDDIEDRTDNENPNIFAELKKWFYGDMRKALDRKRGRIIQIGNIVSQNSLVAEHCDSPNWFSMRYSAIKSDGTPLWADMWSLEQLREDLDEYAKNGLTSLWYGEMMNQIIPEGDQLISTRELVFRERPAPGQLAAGFMTIDPAISDNVKTAHKCVIAVHGLFDEKWQIIDHWSAIATDPIKLYDRVAELASRWGINVVGIESEAYQASIKYVFEYIERSEEMASRLKIIQMPTGKRSKYARISAWVAYLKRGEYCLSRGDIATQSQLMSYDPAKKVNNDDLIDAEAYGVYMIERHMPEVLASKARPLGTRQNIILDCSPI